MQAGAAAAHAVISATPGQLGNDPTPAHHVSRSWYHFKSTLDEKLYDKAYMASGNAC